jgi:RimJ/RimL family protein N-acetyltransferase
MPGSLDVPTLTDGVVTLRAPREDDVLGSWEQCQDPLSQQWTTVPIPYSLADARDWITRVIPGFWASGTEWHFVIEHAGQFAGTITLRPEVSVAAGGRAELAYGSHPRVRGTGAVERAARLLLDWGFAERSLTTVVWWANRGNWASRKLAWRLGFAIEGTARQYLPHRDELRDAWLGTLLRDDERLPRHPWYDVPRITGSGIVLRRHRDGDVPRVLEACTDERTAYWLGGLPSPYTLETARRFVRDRSEGMARGTDLHWMIADPETDAMLGTVSLMHLDQGAAEVGYWAHPDARGRGVMTEAVRLAVRHAFIDTEDGGLGVERLTLYSAVDNAASVHVAEANGFRRTGLERQAISCRDGKHDMAGYDLLAGELQL